MQFLSVRGGARVALAGAVAVAIAGLSFTRVAATVTNELVVADQRAGIALYGFDPVSYFLDGAARTGLEDHELSFRGMTWRFRSAANRAAFREQPDTYVPRFGGYDPVRLARGVPVAGHPVLFVVYEGQLFLFYQPESREKFLAAPEASIEAARSAWPIARRSLVH